MTPQQTGARPSISSRRFTCPHCGAFADQPWWKCWASQIISEPRVPQFLDQAKLTEAISKAKQADAKLSTSLSAAIKIDQHLPQIENESWNITVAPIAGLHVALCASCSEITIWAGRRLIHPSIERLGPAPNEDLPEDIKRDFEEARKIVAESPRGAAALLRLAVQKLCAHLGESGKDINDDIARLVKKGLSQTLQKALDTVRVIGNESVHPGLIDLRDNQEIALALFGLINLIAEQLISTPKRVDELYRLLPTAKLDGIEKRDNRPDK